MTIQKLNGNKVDNFVDSAVNVGNKDTMPLDTREGHEYDNLESFSCHSRAMTRESRSHECRIESGRIPHPVTLGRSETKTRGSTMPQSGRSMVEMLGTLAIIGVLSIGGIMGYSYAVDKYHANQIMNDVNLRGIDLIAQASRGGDFSLDEWPTKTSSDLDIGLEVDEATNTTEGGIYVKDVEKDICEIIADDLLPEEVELVIDGEAYTSGKCGETNKMVFYYDAVAEAFGGGNQKCDGPVVDGKCKPCEYPFSWNETECVCPQGFEKGTIYGTAGRSITVCIRKNYDEGYPYLCPNGTSWGVTGYGLGTCLDCPSGATCENDQVSCPDGLVLIHRCGSNTCEPCPTNSVYSNGECICEEYRWQHSVGENTCASSKTVSVSCGTGGN